MDHRYVSTACLHGLHDYCRSPVKADGSPKDNGPARCKFCSAPCECSGCDHGQAEPSEVNSA